VDPFPTTFATPPPSCGLHGRGAVGFYPLAGMQGRASGPVAVAHSFFFTSFFETRPRRFRGESRGDLQGEDLLLPGQGGCDDEMRVAMDGAEQPEQVYRSEKSSTVWQVNIWTIWTLLGEMQSGRNSGRNAISSSKIQKARRCQSTPRGSV
jgi:hypothetical protein